MGNQPLSFDTSSVTAMGYMFSDHSLSDANKLLIRCAWAGTSAFASAGYGSSWGPGSCPASPSPPLSPSVQATTFTDTASLQKAVQAYDSNPTAAIATYGLMANWDVSAITDMKQLFYGLNNFNADISTWDTSSVTTMSYIFTYASAFNQPLSFDTSKVTDMKQMFGGASAFNQPLSFDTSKVTNMFAMFSQASAFNQPLSFDTSSVTAMDYMFSNANPLSDANKLLIRCAWTGTSAFASAGYGS